ncbi:hypothetical protein ONE63_006269 [Megalurothrips usitatus]|uniref:Larval cuticle protein LCP-17-like n=1 Tax=Megalurothrips usitatus TaxID=439358 RepID=A0AAV7XW30_9NEOP|nr:hypothetical protein ONE63_006269 [Megalurothrips usitatus]
MNSFVVFVALVAAASAAPQFNSMEVKKSTYMVHGAAPAALAAPAWERHDMVEARSGKSMMSKEGRAEILEQAFDMDKPDEYKYHFKTNNDIAMMEEARLDKDAGMVRGSYEWTSPEGVHYKVEYVADENGFHPQAAHLPVAPAVPEAILRSLAYNAAHPEEDKESEMYMPKKMMMH